VECSYLPSGTPWKYPASVRFQSLFWWNVVTYWPPHIDRRTYRAMFQSLFWWNVVTYAYGIFLRGADREVSILVLVECSYLHCAHCGMRRERVFQSLFWWNVVTYYRIQEASGVKSGFQSLFWWNVVTYPGMRIGMEPASGVSILVLVECSYLPGQMAGGKRA